MRRRALIVAVGAAFLVAPSAAGAASAPRVDAMVVGATSVLVPPTPVSVPAAKVKAGRRTCTVGAATPLGVLVAIKRAGGPAFHVRDFGSCSRRAADASGLFVDAIGGEANHGSDGWVYKVGHKAGTTAAADPSGPFGTGRGLRSGQRVLWYWCTLSAGQHCPPTLEVAVDAAQVAAGGAVRVSVKAYDDDGHGSAVAGATVALGGASASTGPDGTVSIAAPSAPGPYAVNATAPGDVAGFPASVAVR
jgi:hypothetical protein